MALFKSKKSKTDDSLPKEPKEIRETKCTCQACENVWYYGKQEIDQNTVNGCANCSKGMMMCGGSYRAPLIQDKKIIDLNKCPKCGSRAITKEEVVHYV